MANDLDQRLLFLEAELSAFRAENERLARELALTHQVLRIRPAPSSEGIPGVTARPVRLPRAACSGSDILFAIDRCETGERLIHVTGWAFCPRIDCGEGNLSLLLEGGDRVFLVKPASMNRTDVAANHAQIDLGPDLPIGSPQRALLTRSGFTVLWERAPLVTGQSYSVSIQIDGPDFSVRRLTELTLHG